MVPTNGRKGYLSRDVESCEQHVGPSRPVCLEAPEGLNRPERFLIVDDHPLFREALQSAIRWAYPEAEVHEAMSIATAKTSIAEHACIDLLLLDLTMPGTTGFEGLLELRTCYPRLPIVIVSGIEDERIVREALAYGCAGFIPKSTRKPELSEAIRQIIDGSVYVPVSYGGDPETMPDSGPCGVLAKRLKTLTPQQVRVLWLIRRGMQNKQIAHELRIELTTVKAHVSEILRKLEVYSRAKAIIEVSRIDFETILTVAEANKIKD